MAYKVLVLNGSPRVNGCTARALEELIRTLNEEGVETELMQVGKENVRGCIACGYCNTHEGCVFHDKVDEAAKLFEEADGLVIGSPVYYGSPNGTLLSFLDRVFFSSSEIFAHKPGAAVAIARRGGTTASFDVMNKYFGISQMPVAGSTYWNIGHGRAPGEIAQDAEGLRTMRNLARSLAWMLKCFEAGKAAGVALPDTEHGEMTNFIR